MFRRILFINSKQNDFLADSILIGLKLKYGNLIVEYPTNKHIYKVEDANHKSLHGIGFTLYNLLEIKYAIDFNHSMSFNDFDLFIFGDIYRQADTYKQLEKYLNRTNTILLDGEDTPALFPYYYAPWKKPYSIIFPKLYKKHIYFKRELIEKKALYYLYYKMLPSFLLKKLKLPDSILPISFSIPNEKIVREVLHKEKLFGKHIVDAEVASKVNGSTTKYAFQTEKSYYEDLQHAKYGITTKRGGWDCLRHYEIAANGAVICFKDLHLKPPHCAPHDLKDGFNCISYSNYEELIQKIDKISDEDYKLLQQSALDWVRKKSCEFVAEDMLERFNVFSKLG